MSLPTKPPPHNIVCPECAIPCVPLNCGPAVIDRCRKCGGLWFDEREIGAFREELRRLDLTQLVPKNAAPDARPSLLGCPRGHKVVMEPFEYGVNTGVRPLRCGKCRGIWLTGHELKTFLAMARLAQEIHPHVMGLTRALEEQNREQEKWRALGELGDSLNAPSSLRRLLRWFWP